jgi:hypothetical protein
MNCVVNQYFFVILQPNQNQSDYEEAYNIDISLRFPACHAGMQQRIF